MRNHQCSPEMAAVIASLSDFPLDVPGQREHYRKVWAEVPVDPDIVTQPVDMGNVGSGDSEWVWTTGSDPSRVFVYFHGGGYVSGEPWMWRQFNGTLSRASGFRGLGFGYRLAPEFPFPMAVEDSVLGYKWLLKSGVEPSKIVLVGDSAGGALVLSVLMTLRDEGAGMPAAGIALSPWTDLELKGETMTPEIGDPLTTEGVSRSMAERYLNGQDPKHPLASAIHADVSGLPPIHIEAGERDVLYADSTRIVKKLREYGTKVTLVSTPGAVHSFPALAGRTPEARDAFQRMGAFMKHAVLKL